jgi:hypothetical protein
MRKLRLVAIATVLVAAAAFVATAMAANPHLRNNVRPNPAFVDNGLTLTGTAAYAGLGNFDTLQTLDATANPTATCTNQGGNQAPGQNPAQVDVTGSTAVPASDIQNGNVTITTTTNPPEQPTAEEAGCPNDNWTAEITDMAFTSATIRVFQDTDPTTPGFETLALTVTCTFNSPTTNGPVPASNYTCTES